MGSASAAQVLALVLSLLSAQLAFASKLPFSVLGYVPEWRYENIDWDALAVHNSHLILFSLEVTAEGGLTALDRLPKPENLLAARKAATAHSTKLLLCLGGYGRSGGFGALVRDEEARAHFIRNLQFMLQDHELDGVDFNWEYPKGKAEWDGLAILIAETRRALGPKKTITMAYYPDGAQERAMQVHNMANDVDFFLMMCYDQPGRHATDAFMEVATMRTLTLLPAEKVALGVPMYARHTRTGDWKSYDELLRTYGDQIKPRDDEVDGYYFNGMYTIERKTRYAIDQKLGGIMIWEVGQDCLSYNTSSCAMGGDGKYTSKDRSLHAAMSRAIKRKLGDVPRDPPQKLHDEL